MEGWKTRKFHIQTSITRVLWDAYEKLSTINICTISRTPSKWSTLPKAAPWLSPLVRLVITMDTVNRTWTRRAFVYVMWGILETTARHVSISVVTL